MTAEQVSIHTQDHPFDESENHIELDPTPAITSTMQVTQHISLIRMVEKQIEQLRKQDAESRTFYADRIARCEQHIGQLKLSILGFLQQHQLKHIHTPVGTAYQKAVTTKTYPPDDELLAWLDQHLPDAVRIQRHADKRKLGDHIKQTGEVPDGYSESTETRLYIK